MKRKQSQFFTEAIVGLFMVAVILLLAYFTIVISGVDILRGDAKVEIQVAFPQVGGLKNHDSVMYRGTKVGIVEFVEVTPTNLLVHALVDRNVIIRGGYSISVRNLSMLGGNFMHIEEGKGEILPLEKTVFAGETPIDWMHDVAEMTKNLKEFTARMNSDNVLGKAEGMIDEIKSGAVDAKAMMADVRTGVTDAKAMMSEVKAAATDARGMMADAKGAVGDIRGAMGEARGVIGDVKGVMADAHEAMAEAKEAMAAFKMAAKSVDAKAALQKAEKLMDSMSEVLKDVRQVLDNYRDTTPISTFSSLATGAL